MKREHFLGLFIFILTAAVGLAGCSDDSTGPSDPPEDEIITGTWQLSSLVFTTGDADLDVTTMDPCLLETTLTFEEDGDFHYLYSSAGADDECSTASGEGTWEHESGTTYSFDAEGLPIGQGTQELTFSSNHNSFSFTEQLQLEGIEGEATVTFDRQ